MNNIDIIKIINIFDNTTSTYKFYLFKILLNLAQKNKSEITFEQIIRQMIYLSWNTIIDYKLNLGKGDNLQKIVEQIKRDYKINDKTPQIKIKKLILNEIEITSVHYGLIKQVPYRLIRPFYKIKTTTEAKINQKITIMSQNSNTAFYKIEKLNKTNESKLILNENWISYFNSNNVILNGWTNYKLIQFLEIKNPNVPNISKKLELNDRINLTNERKLYQKLLNDVKLQDIYSNLKLNELTKEIDLDHFLPWTYVMHNNIWNLIPATKKSNIQKSNFLPSKKYFSKFTQQQLKIFKYCVTNKENKFLEQYKLIYKELDLDKIRQNRYEINEKEFEENLYQVIDAMWETAKNNGFGVWNEE